jgi:hypothetical protein
MGCRSPLLLGRVAGEARHQQLTRSAARAGTTGRGSLAGQPDGSRRLKKPTVPGTRPVFRRLAVQQQQQLETVKTKWQETLRFMQGYAGAKEWGEALGSAGFAERLAQARQALNELEAVDAQYRRTLEECIVLTAAAEGRLDPEKPLVGGDRVVTAGTGSPLTRGASEQLLDHVEQKFVIADAVSSDQVELPVARP